MGWVGISASTAIVAIIAGLRVSRRADPGLERADFRSLGSRREWKLERLSYLPGPIGEFVREVRQQENLIDRVDLIGSQLAEVDAETRLASARFAQLAKVMLAVGALCAIVAMGEVIRFGGAAATLFWSVLPLGPTVATAFWCHWMGRVVSSRIDVRRRAWDALSDLLMRPHMSVHETSGVDCQGATCSAEFSRRTIQANELS